MDEQARQLHEHAAPERCRAMQAPCNIAEYGARTVPGLQVILQAGRKNIQGANQHTGDNDFFNTRFCHIHNGAGVV